MNVKIPAGVSRAATKCLLGLRKASPEIALAAGLVGTIATTVFACKQTTKLDGVLGPRKADIDLIHKNFEDKEFCKKYNYTEKEKKRDIARVYLRVTWDMTKLYGPVLLAEAASLGLVLLSHGQLKARNASLSVALSSLTAAFNEYRNRVRAELGDEADQRFRYGLKNVQIAVKDDDGNETGEVQEVQTAELSKQDLYCRVFDEYNSAMSQRRIKRKSDGTPVYNEYGNPVYIQDVEADMALLHCKEELWTSIKRTRKNHTVYLNEVLPDLGFDTVDYGQDVGWYGKDGSIDFRAQVVTRTDANGELYSTIVLDFNCDGCVREEVIKKPKKRKVAVA